MNPRDVLSQPKSAVELRDPISKAIFRRCFGFGKEIKAPPLATRQDLIPWAGVYLAHVHCRYWAVTRQARDAMAALLRGEPMTDGRRQILDAMELLMDIGERQRQLTDRGDDVLGLAPLAEHVLRQASRGQPIADGYYERALAAGQELETSLAWQVLKRFPRLDPNQPQPFRLPANTKSWAGFSPPLRPLVRGE